MGWGLGRRLRPPVWTIVLAGALSLGACDPEDEGDGEVSDPDAEDASEGDELTDAGPFIAVELEEPAPVDAGAGAPDVVVVAKADAGSTDAAPEAAAPPAPLEDPCAQVPTTGVCRSEHEIALCVVTTGMGEDHVATLECAPDERCTDAKGSAKCVLQKGCVAGTTRCGAGAVETCAADHWDASPCTSECIETPLGAFCAGEARLRKFEGSVRFERKLPNAKLSDWETKATLTPARGFLLLSYHGDELVDGVVTSDASENAGSFSIRVREELSADDHLVVMAAGVGANQELSFVVADPGFTPSSRSREAGTKDSDPAIWSYSFKLSEIPQDHMLTLLEEHGSAACHVFDRLRQIYTAAHDHYKPAVAETVAVWLGIGTAWDCGACSAWSPTKVFDTRFEHQVWLDGSKDQGYWSEAVTAHELGHYVMNAYGFPASEGGPHYLGIPTQPGQAFSEGWATFFSSMMRDSSVHFDKQSGAFFWWDLDRRAYSPRGVIWARAFPWLGLLQLMDENEAASIMLESYRAAGSRAPILDALVSDRMRLAPFARGYKRRTWASPEFPDIFTETSQSIPCLADFLDALVCAGSLKADALTAIVEPSTHFPYKSEAPLCH